MCSERVRKQSARALVAEAGDREQLQGVRAGSAGGEQTLAADYGAVYGGASRRDGGDETEAKLPNMVAFLITRDSIVQALRHEIPASQIIAFLEEYSVNDERMKEADAKLEKNNPGMRMNGRLDDSNFRNEKGMYYKVGEGEG